MILDLLSWILLTTGGALTVISALGLLRFPDVFTRFHAVSISDTLGAGMIFLGLAFQAGFSLVTVKLLLIAAFLILTGPTATHALAKSALHGGLEPDTEEHKP